jgi:CubicO group peptidase (beta-lactamase class C family)
MLQFRDGPAGGAQVLHGSTLREMHRVHWIEPDWAAGWGLGFRITREKGATYVGHSGRLRGFRTLFHLCPADKIGVIVMINADDGNPPVFAEKAFDWVAPAIRKVVNPPEPAGPAPGWQRYAGKYRSPWADAQVLVVDGALAMIDPSQPDPLAAVGRLRPVADHTFRLETKDGYAANAELVVFELDADGHVTRVKVGDNFLMPVTEW